MTANAAGLATRENVVEWCPRKAGFPVNVSMSGKLRMIKSSAQFDKQSVRIIFIRSNDGFCIVLSVVTAV